MRETKITLGEMREAGVRGLLIYCSDYRCSHHLKLNADPWPDDVRLSDLEPKFICKARGRRGADVRPFFQPARNEYDGMVKAKSPELPPYAPRGFLKAMKEYFAESDQHKRDAIAPIS